MMTAWIITVANVSRTFAPAGQGETGRTVASVPAVVVEQVSAPVALKDRTPAIRIVRSMETRAETPSGASWRRRLEDASAALVPFWLIGVLILSARLALGWCAVAGLRRSAVSPLPDGLADRVGVLATRLRIRRVVHVLQSAAVTVPTTIGWLRPIVLVPASALSGLSLVQLEAIIAHELAHVRRHDYAVNILQTVADILLFYHPACWWMSRRIRHEREHCCDDVAVAVCGDAVAYATALTDLESLRSERTLALAATDGPLLQRVRRVIAPVTPRHATSPWAAAAVPLAVAGLLLVGVQATGAIQAQKHRFAVGIAGKPSQPISFPTFRNMLFGANGSGSVGSGSSPRLNKIAAVSRFKSRNIARSSRLMTSDFPEET
jgi:beta-lactamase regulating signal transducer with metallopeptidase domain